jgi:hypothetical protein
VTAPTPNELLAIMVASSFAAGINVYGTIATLGLLGRAGWLVLPPEIAFFGSYWVIGASAAMFAIEFFADKIPVFDLLWNVGQTFVRVPAGALLAWSAAADLSPGAQMLAVVGGGAIALAAHGGKLAMRGAVTPSPEPASNILLSVAEDVLAIGLTWFAVSHPYLAAAITVILLACAGVAIWIVWTVLGHSMRRLRGWLVTGSTSPR